MLGASAKWSRAVVGGHLFVLVSLDFFFQDGGVRLGLGSDDKRLFSTGLENFFSGYALVDIVGWFGVSYYRTIVLSYYRLSSIRICCDTFWLMCVFWWIGLRA